MKFGSSSSRLAAIIPETALSIAASPQPMPSITATRMPRSRLVAGPTADARICSPSRVKRKKTNTIATQISEIADHAQVLLVDDHAADVEEVAGGEDGTLQELDLR